MQIYISKRQLSSRPCSQHIFGQKKELRVPNSSFECDGKTYQKRQGYKFAVTCTSSFTWLPVPALFIFLQIRSLVKRDTFSDLSRLKMAVGSALTPDSAGDEDKNSLMALSITELISILRTAYRTVDFDRVEEVLVSKETNLRAEIGVLSEKLEKERLERIDVEGQLKKYKEQCERGEKAEERYEKLLQAVKKGNVLDGGNTTAELRNKIRKLEDEKRRAESEVKSWKRKCEKLNGRLLTAEKAAKSFMDGHTQVELRGNAEDSSGVRRNTDPGVSTEAIDEMEVNEVVTRVLDNVKTPADSFPSQRKTKFVNLAPDDADNAQLGTQDIQSDTEVRHDDRSIQQQYDAYCQHRGVHREVQDSSGKSCWCKISTSKVPSQVPSEVWEKDVDCRMDPKTQEVATTNKRKRSLRGVKQTVNHTSGLKTQTSKKAEMDAQHQRKINGNEMWIEVNKHTDGIASSTVQTKIDMIVEKQSQEGSSDEIVMDGRVDISTQALGNPEPSETNLTQMLSNYMSHYSTSTPSDEKVPSLGQQLQELKALNSLFSQFIKKQSSCNT
ncbi:uncharacterized protein LOC129302626 [Prosopis cineraria]|uniref:uncharacterized protein LOC129302626 n=1 Tax=Prosopis cineraria TaxID=364024 RepID=UPI00240EFE68|nr:uncharacterized protein LOC129302626 [Prosopis cineraria]